MQDILKRYEGDEDGYNTIHVWKLSFMLFSFSLRSSLNSYYISLVHGINVILSFNSILMLLNEVHGSFSQIKLFNFKWISLLVMYWTEIWFHDFCRRRCLQWRMWLSISTRWRDCRRILLKCKKLSIISLILMYVKDYF